MTDATHEREAAAGPIPTGIYCPDCGYDLRALTSERCPECGLDLAKARVRFSQIPWSQRAARGRFHAYWATVWFVLRQPSRLLDEAGRPVDERDARLFHRLTVVHAIAPLPVGLVAYHMANNVWGQPVPDGMLWVLLTLSGWLPLVLLALPAVSRSILLPGHLDPERLRRAMALSDYAYAPWALPVLATPALVGVIALWNTAGEADFALLVVCIGLYLVAAFLTDHRLDQLAVRVGMRGPLERWGRRLGWLLGGVLVALASLLLPLLVILLLTMYASTT